jgi:hypothetical protein
LKAFEGAVMTLPKLQQSILSPKNWLLTLATASDKLLRSRRSRCRTQYAAINSIVEDQVAKDQQESL